MQDLQYRQEVLLYQKFVIENKSEKAVLVLTVVIGIFLRHL